MDIVNVKKKMRRLFYQSFLTVWWLFFVGFFFQLMFSVLKRGLDIPVLSDS